MDRDRLRDRLRGRRRRLRPRRDAAARQVNLADRQGIAVTGDFKPGDFIPIDLTFAEGETAGLEVPVVAAVDEKEGRDEGQGPRPGAEARPSLRGRGGGRRGGGAGGIARTNPYPSARRQ